MKVNIKKQGKTKRFNLIKSWDEVSLENWLKLIELETGSRTNEAVETITMLSNIPKQLVKELSIQDVAVILNKVAGLQAEKDSSLKRIIEVEGKEYGFHPDLDSLTLGEYADIETIIKEGIENSLPEVMAILYRPIVEKKNNKYTIEAYDGDITIRAEEMKKMSAGQVQSALVFFWHFVNELLSPLPLYLMERLQKIQDDLQQKVSQKNGVGSE
jgi:hypothetical protein